MEIETLWFGAALSLATKKCIFKYFHNFNVSLYDVNVNK